VKEFKFETEVFKLAVVVFKLLTEVFKLAVVEFIFEIEISTEADLLCNSPKLTIVEELNVFRELIEVLTLAEVVSKLDNLVNADAVNEF
jgi:hypothetical protein